jgi:amidohydrolase
VGLLETGRPGPTLLVRADMDALPITEETGRPFASQHPGVMHACGHDGHTAMVLATATAMNALKDRISGTIKFVFQPAEEGPGGAKPMIEAGVMDAPHVDYALGCHIWPAIPEGTVGIRAGALLAAMFRFDLTIKGKGGHGAMPHLCVDALETGCQVVSALQRIVSRKMNPLSPSVSVSGNSRRAPPSTSSRKAQACAAPPGHLKKRPGNAGPKSSKQSSRVSANPWAPGTK